MFLLLVVYKIPRKFPSQFFNEPTSDTGRFLLHVDGVPVLGDGNVHDRNSAAIPIPAGVFVRSVVRRKS